jgi:hypothetical protein
MVVGVVDRVGRVRDCKRLGTRLAVNVVISATVHGKVRLLVNDGSRARISSSAKSSGVSLLGEVILAAY